MKNTEEALRWIVGILEKHKIPFQITGGFAAKIYGSKRPLNDIDIDIFDKDFSKIAGDAQEFIIYGPAHYIDERWDCILMTLNFNGQKIDISGASSMRICDDRTGEWKDMPADLSKAVSKEIYGRTIPVIPPEDLIDYKSMLAGEHQKEDIMAVSGWSGDES
ncbi:MAG: hypothetical protein ABII19_01205 [Patescibacteria group bacterium]